MYVVESKGEKLVLWGDLVHVAAGAVSGPGGEPYGSIRIPSKPPRNARRYLPMPPVVVTGSVAPTSLSRAWGTWPRLGDAYAWVPVNYPQPQ